MVAVLTTKRLLLLLILSISTCLTPVLAQQAYSNDLAELSALGALQRAERFAKPTPEAKPRIIAYAARQEWEGFQFLIHAKRAAQISQVSWQPLRHASGYELLEMAFFRQRFISVTNPSPYSPFEPREWPDILLPVRDTADAIKPEFRAFPQRVEAGENIPVWGDVFVPDDAPSGWYQGLVHVTLNTDKMLSLPISLFVWNFSLDKQKSLRTVFGTNSFRVGEIYGSPPQESQSAEKNQLIRRYNDFLLDHHLSPEDLWDASPRLNWETEKINTDFKFKGLGSVSENLKHYQKEKGLSAYTYRFSSNYPFHDTLASKSKSQAYMLAYANWCQQLMGAGRCYTDPSFIDEPDTREAYDEVRLWGRYFDQIKPASGEPIRFLISEPPFASDASHGSLYGSADVWVGKFMDYWLDAQFSQRNAAKQRLQLGEELWAYTALALDFKQYRKKNPRADALQGNYPFVWQLDYPAINYRLGPWLFHRHGITGLGYWDTIAYPNNIDPWQQPDGFRIPYSDGSGEYIFNGDGVLIYPAFQQTTGKDEPIASMRLKWIRESVEDFSYIERLLAQGEHDFVAQEINRIARDYGDWQNDPALLLDIRQRLGQRLHDLATME